jgi:hypothetical protein
MDTIEYTLGNSINKIPQVLFGSFIWLCCLPLAELFSQTYFGETYNQLDKRRKIHWRIRVISTVHATIATFLALQTLMDPVLQKDKLFGYSMTGERMLLFSCTYFLYDGLISLYYFSEFGVQFVAHGMICFTLYFLGLRPFLFYYGGVFLLFEISTPFLNINWFLDKLGKTGTPIQMINGACLVLTFFCSRIVFGLYSSFVFWSLAIEHFESIPLPFVIIYCSANIVLNLLNAYWFSLMIPAVLSRLGVMKKVD